MTVGNIESKQIVEVCISFIQQAKIFEGAYHINIPRGLILLLTECRQNSDLSIDINCTAPISDIFCPAILKRTDHGLINM